MRLLPLLPSGLLLLMPLVARANVAGGTAWQHFQRQAAEAMRQLAAEPAPASAPIEAEPVELVFNQLFAPVGDGGLEYAPALRARAGQRVSLVGHMVRVADRAPGGFILVPRPLRLDAGGSGEMADLPPTAVYVRLDPAFVTRDVGFRPGRVRVTGRLELGVAAEDDGRNSALRLQLDAGDSVAWSQGP